MAVVGVNRCIQGNPSRFRFRYNAVGGLAVFHDMAMLVRIADAKASCGDEVGGEAGGGSQHPHD